MWLGTNRCGMLSEVIVRLNLRLECVVESVGHEILQFRQVSGTHCHARAAWVWGVDKSTMPIAAKNWCFWPLFVLLAMFFSPTVSDQMRNQTRFRGKLERGTIVLSCCTLVASWISFCREVDAKHFIIKCQCHGVFRSSHSSLLLLPSLPSRHLRIRLDNLTARYSRQRTPKETTTAANKMKSTKTTCRIARQE